MYVPVFGETVAFAYLAGIAVAIRTVMPFDESGINRFANCRCFYGRGHLDLGAKDNTQINFDYPALSPHFMNGGIFQTLWRNTARTFRPATFACPLRLNLSPISLQNRPFIRLILIRCNQIHNTTISSFLKIKDQFLNVFRCTFARDNAYYQTVLWIISYMIPVIALLTVSRVMVITAFLLLAYKGPFLIELNLDGLWGKRQPVHREAPWRVRQPVVNNASLYFYLRRPDGLFCVLRSFQKYARAMRWLFSDQASYGTAVCLFVQKIASCMFGSTADGYGYFCRICRILSDYLRCVFRNQGIFYSDNKILKEPALSCLPNVNLYGTTTCPSFGISAKTSKIIQLC